MKFKIVLGAFLFVFSACLIAMIIFVQTEYFGKVVSTVASDISTKKYDAELGFRKFSISLFPPGIELSQVKLRKVWSPSEVLESELGTLGLYLGLVEFEEKKLTFGEIKVKDSIVTLKKPKSEEEIKELDQKIIDKIFNLNRFSPFRIDKLTFENTKFTLNNDSFDVHKLKLFKTGKSIIARFHITNLNLEALKGQSIDEIWADTEVYKNRLKIFRLRIQHDVHTALVKGQVKDYHKLLGSEIDLNGETQVYLRDLEHYLPPSLPKVFDGVMRTSFIASYRSQNITASADVFIEGLRSDAIYADEVRSVFNLENDSITMNRFELVQKSQKLILGQPVILYSGKQKQFLPTPLKVTARNFLLSNGLRFWGEKTKSLEGSINGTITAEVKPGNFQVILGDDFNVENFTLSAGTKEKPFEILRIKKAILEKTKVKSEITGLKISSILQLAHSKLEISGDVGKGKINFKAPLSKIDLTDFGNISQLGITGVGELALAVEGTPGDVQIHLTGRTKNFSILSYYLDETEKDILIDLGASTVFINKLESKVGKTALTGSGSVNYKNADIALGLSTSEASANDLREILTPIFGKIQGLPEDFDLKAKVDVDIFGKYKLPELNIKSRVSFTDLSAFGETVNSGNFDLSLQKEVLKFQRIELLKGSGTFSGDFSMDLRAKSFFVKAGWENLELTSFDAFKRKGLNVNSTFSGKLEGNGPLSDYRIKMQSSFFNTRNSTYRFSDSSISLQAGPRRLSGDIRLLGDILTSRFDYALKDTEPSRAEFELRTDDLKPVMVILAGPHLELESVTGRVHIKGDTSFEKDFKNLDLILAFKNLSFNHPDFNFNYTSDRPELIVRNGKIERLSLELNQPDVTFVTRGRGSFGESVTLELDSKINSKILEILSSSILSSDGFIENKIKLSGLGSELNFSLSSKSSDLDLSIENLPVQVDNLKYNISYASKRLRIDHFIFAMENGSFNLKGDVFFDSDQPDVNLKFIFDRAEIPILGKSSLNMTGEGIVLGNNYPYSVGGEITINRASIVNELNEFNKKSAGFSQVRFLPKTQDSPLGKMFSLNLNLKAETPIRLANSLMDVALGGEVRLLGNPGRLKGEGRLSTPPNSSRIFFKNSEYFIQRADINFNPQKDLGNPDFDVQAMTTISSYKIYPKAYGDLERFNFDLTSEPALPRNSILSLIAFGYTDEIQRSLYAKDQQSLTQVGVGSFVFDRFKISDILNKQFGLQVNLGTVIEQSATDSLLSGRNQSGVGGQSGGALGRTRSATKIELKKRLDEALTLSVSSTMGGTIGQRQSMNLNYGVSRNIQLEGVYELRTNEEGQADIIYNSIGGDIKFRRTFK